MSLLRTLGLLSLLATASALSQVPAPWTSQDIGPPALAGSATESSGTFTIDAGGTDIWGSSDEFHYVWQPLTGDASIIARVTSQTETDVWAKAGVMIRETLSANSAHAMTIMTPGNGAQFQRRTSTGGNTSNTGQSATVPHWLRLDRVGNTFTGYHSPDGIAWSQIGSESITMAASVQVGLAVTSHNAGTLSTAVLDNISIGAPPPPPPPPVLSTNGYLPIFNGTNFDGWYSFLDGLGIDNDPDNVLKVVGGQVHLLDVADTVTAQPFGYFATNDDYRNYRLRFEYKWGTKKYPPRENAVRDSGLLYHQKGNDVIWPTCIESQVQENDTGDFFLLGGTSMDTTIVAAGNNTYQEGGVPRLNSGASVTHSAAYDSLTDWNVSEVIVTEAEGIHIVNGNVNNRGTDFMHAGAPLNEGKIAFQVEGAEIFYRNIEVKPLFTTGGGPEYKVLVFSKTTGFRHGSIASGITAIQEIAVRNGFTVDATEDATLFNDANLAQYACVIWLNTTGDPLNATQEAAFERYIQAGGGYVGVHAATDTEYSWAWYGNLVGAYFNGHPAIQDASLCVCDDCHPSTESLGTDWMRRDEWYNFNPDPTLNPNISILVTIDETSYSGGTMGTSHPISWCQEYDGGRSWYTAMGHTNETYDEPQFRMHLLGGIEWAAGKSRKPTSDKTILFDGTDPSAWEKLSDGTPITWPIVADSLQVDPGSGNIVTTADYQDFRLHLEFRPNSTNATGEQDRGNSGVYLQGRYEIQVLDSYNRALDGENDCAAIYNVKNADSQEAWPADAWQHYDIWFRAPRWNGSTKIENARVTVFWNGERVHDGVEIPGTTTAGLPEGPTDGPIMLQDHSNAVRFRNIWIEPNTSLPSPLNPFIKLTDLFYNTSTDEFTVTWDSNLPGPKNIVTGIGSDLQALSAPPNHLLPIPAATGVTSPATFPVPASLSGQPQVFLQVTD